MFLNKYPFEKKRKAWNRKLKDHLTKKLAKAGKGW